MTSYRLGKGEHVRQLLRERASVAKKTAQQSRRRQRRIASAIAARPPPAAVVAAQRLLETCPSLRSEYEPIVQWVRDSLQAVVAAWEHEEEVQRGVESQLTTLTTLDAHVKQFMDQVLSRLETLKRAKVPVFSPLPPTDPPLEGTPWVPRS